MENFFECELARALQIRAFVAAFRDDAFALIGEQAHGLGAPDVDAENRHSRYITCMLVLSGADLVLPDVVQPAGTLVIDGDRIVQIGAAGAMGLAGGAADLTGHVIVPGFVDVHVHGIEGRDTLDDGDAVAEIAARLPKYGTTAFCPTTVACDPQKLREVLGRIAAIRDNPPSSAARVLSAHLESNFINPRYKGAQPEACLCLPEEGSDVIAEIERAGPNVAIVTLAPELDGAIDLIRRLVASGRRVSLGHSGATFAQARAAIDAGARHATHLFNRMPPMGHREPGLAGAILASPEVAAEIICDGIHVHPQMVRVAVRAKGVAHVMAITDSVAAAGLGDGATAFLGGRRICVRSGAAYLDDDTLAGSVATMDQAFRFLVRDVGLSLPEAARLCATTSASELGLAGIGAITNGAIADLVVLGPDLQVRRTYVGGQLVHAA